MSPKRKRAGAAARKKPARELSTILDFVRYAVSRFRAAKLVFAHGTTDPVAEAAFLVGEALHLPPERFDAFSRARVTGAERAAILRLIAARVRSRQTSALAVERGEPDQLDQCVVRRQTTPHESGESRSCPTRATFPPI